jgi:hypothetical protein
VFDWGLHNTNRHLESSAILKASAPQSSKARAVLAQMPEAALAAVLRKLSRFQPTVVLANLSATSFEVLRYLPTGVFRVGVGLSDHPTTYE